MTLLLLKARLGRRAPARDGLRRAPPLDCRSIPMFAIRDPIRYDDGSEPDPMSECKHGLRHGCAYCHVTTTKITSRTTPPEKNPPTSALSVKLNDRKPALKLQRP